MMENGFVSPRGDRFPAGLRVLVVDDDPTWLKILEKMLRKCSFEPTICGRATTALDILRERKDGFDIVISDVNMPDMDGFNLLEQVGLEMNLPVIMMSVNGETSRVMKGVQHGACDYLLKPIRMKELQNIWQHVLRKKINGVVNIESHEGNENIQKMENMLYEFDGSHVLTGADSSSEKKRKELENHGLDDYDFSDPSSAKKTRLVWSIELHQKFVSAVNRIGLDKVGPKKILDLMNVPWLTRENVASHLQKYRLYLSRLQNQDDPNSSSDAINKPHFSYKDPPESFGQKPTALNQKTESGCTFGYSGSKRPFQDLSPEVHENVAEDTRMCAVNLLGSGIDVNHTPLQSGVPQQHSWSGEIQMMHFTQRPTEEQKLRKYTNLHLPSPDYHIQMEYLNPVSSDNPRTCITATDKTGGGFEVKPLCAEHRDNHSVETETKSINSDVFCAMPTSISFTDINSHDFDQYYASNLESQRQSYGPETLASSQGHLQPFSLQASVENVALNNLEFFCPEQGTELSTHFYDGVNLISGYQCEPIDYSTINESLFIL